MVDEIDDCADEAKSAGEKVEQSHANLVCQEALDAGGTKEADQRCQKNRLGVASSCSVHQGELLGLLIGKVLQETLDIHHLVPVKFWKELHDVGHCSFPFLWW